MFPASLKALYIGVNISKKSLKKKYYICINRSFDLSSIRYVGIYLILAGIDKAVLGVSLSNAFLRQK